MAVSLFPPVLFHDALQGIADGNSAVMASLLTWPVCHWLHTLTVYCDVISTVVASESAVLRDHTNDWSTFATPFLHEQNDICPQTDIPHS
jgi:hypothetical protein